MSCILYTKLFDTMSSSDTESNSDDVSIGSTAKKLKEVAAKEKLELDIEKIVSSKEEHDRVENILKSSDEDANNVDVSNKRNVMKSIILLDEVQSEANTLQTELHIKEQVMIAHMENVKKLLPAIKDFDMQLPYLIICIQKSMKFYNEIYKTYIESRNTVNAKWRNDPNNDFAKMYGSDYSSFDYAKRKFRTSPRRYYGNAVLLLCV